MTIHTKIQSELQSFSDNAAVALDLGSRGYRVFPITQKASGKWTPIKGWQSVASTDSAIVTEWWRKSPEARVGLPCGQSNGIAVLDVDEKNETSGSATLATLGFPDVEAMSPVRTRTPSGGWHLFFRVDPRLHNSVGDRGRGIGLALDIRTGGGFVVAPGSYKDEKRYEPIGAPLGSVDLPAWPEALIPAPRPEYATSDPSLQPVEATEAQCLWAQRKLEELAESLATTREGGRNYVANAAALWAGGAGALGFVAHGETKRVLVDAALAAGLDRREAEDTFDHGWNDGLRRPIADYPRAIIAETLLDEEPADEPSTATRADNNKQGGEKLPPLNILSIEESTAGSGREYLVKGFLARGDLACIFGQPGAGKSLIAPFLCHCIATGSPAFGMRVKQGAAWYLAAEDSHGLAWRAEALQRRYGTAKEFRLVNDVTAPQSARSEQWTALRAAVKAERPALVVVDTLAMAFPGIDENKAESMGTVVIRARELTRWGAVVILVHHAPKAGDTPRGHSLLNGALDVALHLESKDSDGIVRGRLTKNRNGSSDREFAFKIGVEAMGTDEDGDSITFALCEPLEGPAAFKRHVLTVKEATALDIALGLMSRDRSFDRDTWRARCVATGAMADSTDPKAHSNGFGKVRRELLARGYFVEGTDRIFVSASALAERDCSSALGNSMANLDAEEFELIG